MKIMPVILSGGSGTRLWPLSRQVRPKQFLNLLDKESLFTRAIKLVSDKDIFSAPIIISNCEYRFFINEELEQLETEATSVILEPNSRNTAPAIAAAAHVAIREMGEDAVLLVMPSDHIIKNADEFLRIVRKIGGLVEKGNLITFGIQPSYPETAYGYIEKGNEEFSIKRFVEKPDMKTAKQFVANPDFYWNSGMFAFSAKTYLEELDKYEPEIVSLSKKAVEEGISKNNFLYLHNIHFSQCKDISVDYAVFERSDKIKMLSFAKEIGWNDLGNFNALYEESDKDQHNNAIIGDVISEENEGCYLRSDKGLLVAIGLKNIIAVQVNDVTLIVDRNSCQAIKELVQKLRKLGRTEHIANPKIYRPWGSYEEILLGEGFKVKYILVKPGHAISLQYHNHRAEHWIVVEGSAKVTSDDKETILNKDQSTYIPIGTKHRIENTGKTVLEFIEVQTGDYLDEDDIVRLEDRYNRC